jgi:hypothetical protein
MQANPNSILFLFSLVLIEEWDYFCYISLKKKKQKRSNFVKSSRTLVLLIIQVIQINLRFPTSKSLYIYSCYIDSICHNIIILFIKNN